MGKYNFENDNHDMDETRVVGEIQEKIKELEKKDDLGDKDAFLDAFSSANVAKKEETGESFEGQGDTIGIGQEGLPVQNLKTQEEDSEQEEIDTKKTKKVLAFGALLGAVAFILLFGLARCFSGGSTAGVIEEKEGAILGIIEEVDANGTLSVFDMEEEKKYEIKTNKNTVFLDQEEQPWDLKIIEPGWILSVSCDEKTGVAKEIRYSDKVWEKEEITVDELDTQGKKIVVEGDAYSYGLKTLFLSQEKEISQEDVAVCDVVTLRGVGDEVYVVDVVHSHGYVAIKNKEKIKNGVLTIDGEVDIPLSGEERIPVAEGSHTLLVTGDNIEQRQITVVLQAGEEYTFDLSLAQEKTGVLIIKANVPSFQLTVNATVMDGSKPVVLTLGEYDIVVSQEGYRPVSKHISLQQPSLTMTVDLEEDVKYAQVQFLANQSGATVYLNQEEIGVAPIQKKLKYGNYQVMVKKEGYEIYTKTITVGSPQQDVNITLAEVQ